MIRTFTKKHFAVLAVAFAMIVSTSANAQIYWDFGTASALSAYPASGIPANITVDSVTKGNSVGTPFLSASSVSSGYVGASGAGNAGTTAKIGPLDYTVNTTTGSAFYEITLTPAVGYAVNVTGISFGSRSTGTGPKRYSIRTDLDAYATEAAGDTITSATSTWGLRVHTLALTGSVGTPLKIRIYGYAGAGTVGAVNYRIDDLNIVATAISSSPSVTTDPQNASSCSGQPATFGIAASGALTYQWEENSGSGFTTLTNTGVYSGVDSDTLTISDNTGLNGNMYRCIAMNLSGNDTSAAATLTENIVVPSVTISGTTTVCENDSIVGIATGVNVGANPIYTWYVAGIGPIGNDSVLVIPAGAVIPGTYTVTCELMSDATCASPTTVMSTPIVVTINAAPATPTITMVTSFELAVTASYDSYQWFFEGAPLGTDSTQAANVSGIYTVVVTNAEGCSTISDDYSHIIEGINEYGNAANISVYPNPSKSGVFSYTTDAAKAVVTVYNIIGKQISVTEVTKGTHTLDLSAQANGSYFMSIKTSSSLITKKVIVSK